MSQEDLIEELRRRNEWLEGEVRRLARLVLDDACPFCRQPKLPLGGEGSSSTSLTLKRQK